MDTSLPAVEKRLTAFRQRCAERGLVLTPQRLAIYQVLAGDDSHPSAEDIFRRLKPVMPSLSLGTVYRTLEVFEASGLVSRMHAFGDQALFEANLEPHHHLICLGCKRIMDLQDPRFEELPIRENVGDGFRVLAQRIHLLGLCRDCQDREAASR